MLHDGRVRFGTNTKSDRMITQRKANVIYLYNTTHRLSPKFLSVTDELGSGRAL